MSKPKGYWREKERSGSVTTQRKWDWQTASDVELRGVELVASGFTPAQAEVMAPGCRAKELDRARLTGWIECKALVRARLVREQRDDFQSIIGQSQKLILQALTGEVNPGDDRVKLATVALQHTLWRIVRAPSGSGLLEGIDEEGAEAEG